MKKIRFTRPMRLLALLAIALSLGSCAPKPEPHKSIPVGETRLAVHGGNIWYKVSGVDKGLPVVLIHGGPGTSSYYLKPFEDLGNERQVVRYDQLGSGKSDKTSDTTMFNIGHFVRELDSLRASLAVEKWHLLGQSWGTIVAVEYYKVHPERVVSLTLSGPALDIPAWEKHANELVKTLSPSAQRAVQRAEASKNYEDTSYQAAMMEFYGKYVMRQIVPEDFDSTMSTMNQAMYVYMQGASEFKITGTLKYYDATPFLNQIKVPVLYTTGEFDEANPATVQRFASLTPNSKFVVLPGGSHMTTWDARDENIRVVREFLRSVDSVGTGAKL